MRLYKKAAAVLLAAAMAVSMMTACGGGGGSTNGLCQWPKDGYKIYKYVSTSQSGNTVTIVLADEAGKQYTITVVEGVPNGLTVKDGNGNVVTDQFKWLMQGE